MKICIVDYKVGNLGSILNMLKKIGVPAVRASHPHDLVDADKIILPGVGSFDHAVQNLRDSGFLPLLEEKVLVQKTPLLGICIGMHLLMEGSDEGTQSGLGWIPGRVRKIVGEQLRVPHMGWNYLRIVKDDPILKNFDDDSRFYFVHSFYVDNSQSEHTLVQTEYGQALTAGVRKENIWGFQFHPEKSHKYGMQFFKNFAAI